MSDRAVFVPFREHTDYEWADVVIREGASTDEVRAAAARFVGMGGPHKVFVTHRDDARFLEFVRFLSDEYSMEEDAESWSYSVWLPEDFANKG